MCAFVYLMTILAFLATADHFLVSSSRNFLDSWELRKDACNDIASTFLDNLFILERFFES